MKDLSIGYNLLFLRPDKYYSSIYNTLHFNKKFVNSTI